MGGGLDEDFHRNRCCHSVPMLRARLFFFIFESGFLLLERVVSSFIHLGIRGWWLVEGLVIKQGANCNGC